MKISNVMVSLDRGAAAADRVQLSARLAERFDATLTGVAARQVPALIAVSDVRESERIYEIEDRHGPGRARRGPAVFLREAERASARPGGRARRTHGLSRGAGTGRRRDRGGAPRAADGDPGLMGVSAGALLMEVGRPVLVVPPGIERLTANGSWWPGGTRGSPAGRLQDALPFLSRAEAVQVVVVGARRPRGGAEDVAAYLSGHGGRRHHPSASEPRRRGRGGVPPVRAARGRRPHRDGRLRDTRLREWIFGGATRDILQATAPLLPDEPLMRRTASATPSCWPASRSAARHRLGPGVQRGTTLARTHCARCHAVGRTARARSASHRPSANSTPATPSRISARP